jgi:uncharacterized protein YjiS (DUF1127 family)
MSAIDQFAARRAESRAGAPSIPIAGPLVAAVSAWYRRRRVRAALDRLSDRELADIGLERGEAGYCSILPPSRGRDASLLWR